jgi:hypothetical protein
MYSGEDSVLIVDALSFTDRMFSAFLKPLENSNMLGDIWFFNLPITKYPFTIRSRCQLIKSPVAYMRGSYLKQIEKYYDGDAEPIRADVYSLHSYGIKIAIDMALDKGDFIEMLNCMDMSENFSVFMSHIEKVNYTYIYLLGEWLDGSEIFTANQLMRCPWLPEVNLYIDTQVTQKDIAAIFTQLFAHKMVKT